jgi:hypothetical protein
MAGNPFWTFWYFHIPNYVLAVVMYTLIGRFVLAFLFAPDSPNYIWRGFRRITDWAVAVFSYITPRYIHPLFLPMIGAYWLFVIRHAYFVVMARAALVGGATTS